LLGYIPRASLVNSEKQLDSLRTSCTGLMVVHTQSLMLMMLAEVKAEQKEHNPGFVSASVFREMEESGER
jgi:hypothetical protein